MISLLFLLPIYILGAYASGYSDVCPSKDGTTATLANGYAYTYACGKTGTASSHYTVVKGINTVEKCATACQNSPRCMGSAWSPTLATCSLFDSGEQVVSLLGSMVFHRTESRGGDEACKAVQDRLDQCIADLGTATSGLNQCQDRASGCAASLEQCQGQSGGGQGEAPTLLRYYQSAVEVCTTIRYQVDGYIYRIHCNQAPRATYVGNFITGEFATCARSCSEMGDQCGGFIYKVRDRSQCHLFSSSKGLRKAYDLIVTALRE